jgi:hypothetical protein
MYDFMRLQLLSSTSAMPSINEVISITSNDITTDFTIPRLSDYSKRYERYEMTRNVMNDTKTI